MSPYASHLFCITRRDLGSVRICAPSIPLAHFLKEGWLRGGSFLEKLLKYTTSVMEQVEAHPCIIGSNNTVSCCLPLLPSCDVLYLSVNISPHLIPRSFSRSLYLCLSLCCSHIRMPTHTQEKLGIAYWAERQSRHIQVGKRQI